jgi:Abortive infection alpha
MMYEAQARLATMEIKETKPATLSIALPILQGAADEDREELVDLWARLLASAMDATKDNVRYSFISAVKDMDPPDAKIMHYMYSEKVGRIRRAGSGHDKKDTSVELISREVKYRDDDVEVSLEHLEALGFLGTAPNDKHVWFPNARFRAFMRACYPELGA